MGLETGTYISDLVSTNPLGSDAKSTADDHLRLIKSCVKATFPNVSGAVTPTHTELNYVDGVTSAIQTQLDAKGAHAGQTWTGTQNFTGATITFTTQSANDNSTKGATTSYVDTGLALKGNINAQTWTGTHTFSGACVVPTMSAGNNSTNAASTAFTAAAIAAAAFSAVLPSQSGNAGKYVTTDGTTASWGIVNAALHLLSSASASSSATIDFTTGITTTYDEYLIDFQNVVPATSPSQFYMRASSDSGSTFLSTPVYVTGGRAVDNLDSLQSMAASGDSKFPLSMTAGDGVKNAGAINGAAGISGHVRLYRPASNRYAEMSYSTTHKGGNANVNPTWGNGQVDMGIGNVLNAVRFMFSAGNITSGEFKFYGIVKS